MFEKILIANRAEIACRIIATARRLGVASVGVYSDADSRARHVELADEAWPLGASIACESYLSIDKIIDIGRRSGAQAVHPGYGFLSENAEFAERCAQSGLTFVGPPARAIRLMGSKRAAKSLMARAGVPVLPGYHGDAQDVASLTDAAERIGFPVLVKASAGGGGKGMRIAKDATDLRRAIEGAKREALAAFADDDLLIEKLLVAPRHVEVQIFCDAHGAVVAFPERDCSVQRRRQKIIEETPAPGLGPHLRAALREAALAAAEASAYVGAGTVEFLVEDDAFYFLEMNARLQVEHPVTEMVSGLDLVEWQLRVAAGESLPATQDELTTRGHAIEARLYAECPARDFLPSTGIIAHLREPRRDASLRIDTGVRNGDEITSYYDPLIAKIIARGEDRAGALARISRALSEYEIVGVETNLDLLRAIVADEDFAAARIDTQFLPRHWELVTTSARSLDEAEATIVLAAAAAARISDLRAMARSGTSGDPRSPWALADCWRLNAQGRQTFVFALEGDTIPARVAPCGDRSFGLETPVASVDVEAMEREGVMRIRIDGVERKITIVRRASGCAVILDGRNHEVDFVDPLAPPSGDEMEAASVAAPLPARVVDVRVAAGDEAKRGETLLTLEAMKMEIALTAPRDVRIAEVRRAVGEMAQQGEALVIFAKEESE